MSTPLFRRMKKKSTTFYAMPSTSTDPNPKFSKFMLLNIPAKVDDKIMDFDLSGLNGNYFDIYTDNINPTSSYADQLIESLRNYVANYDTTMRESKLNQTNDFYNIDELQTPTEKIFWKWLRKFGAIDFEPAENKIDWDKNLPYFENPNSDTTTNTSYFRKYLWKEREVTNYNISGITYLGPYGTLGNNILKIYSDFPAKFKVGDEIILTGDISDVTTGVTYEVLQVDEGTSDTYVYINDPNVTGSVTFTTATMYLNYQRVVRYIGEINVESQVHTATKDETEVTAYIPHQAGSTPTVMWDITDDANYYPGLELPLLSEQIQTEIRGAENLESPIRQNPGDYPGLYFGQFDDANKTYLASSGDKIRYSGDYYGILRNNNVGLDEDDYIERLSEFNSNNIDGMTMDFDLEHYLKMSITDQSVGFNFDEFNQLVIDGVQPQDFEYNAILWYYEKEYDDGTGVIHNLYGITFLNNPDNDDDIDPEHISTYDKLTQTEEHDGLSYVHVLNLSTSVDNDTSSLAFDPLTLNNTFGFDLYNNLMSNVGKLNESFINIINEFVRVNDELNDVKSIVYSQTDIDLIKSKLKNMEELLKLYSQYQFVETDTVKIEENFEGTYPTLAFNVRGVEYESVVSIKSTDIYNYMVSTQDEYPIIVPETNKLFLKVTNDDVTNYGTLDVIFSNDLEYKQSAIIYVDSNIAFYPDKMNIYMNYDNGSVVGQQKTLFIDNVYLPVDVSNYIPDNITYENTRWLSTSTYQNVNLVAFIGTTGTETARTVLYTSDSNIFGDPVNDQRVYVHDLLMVSGNTVIDYSGIYTIKTTEYTPMYIKIELDSYGLTPIGIPRIYAYKGLKLEILRVDESSTSTLEDRYLIQKTFI
jgi:hypothetical protein